MKAMQTILDELLKMEHGFKPIETKALNIFK